MGKTSPKNLKKQKRKAGRVIARATVTRNQGNTAAVRKRLKRTAGKVRASKAAAG